MRRRPNDHKIRKNAWKSKPGNQNSQTTGKSKGIRPSPLQKYMCRANRSWKHPRYNEVMASIGVRTKTK